ncbi:4-methylaminobutanoate oxidase (formaldehyde-forming) [Candidatus Entotheonellaceae bacterium PAL068K]
MQREAAVLIIGGGIFGCSIAFHLAKKGQQNVVLLEKNALASGTTPLAAGLVPQIRVTEQLTRAMTYSIELFENFQAETGCPEVFQQVGSLKVATDDARVAELEAHIAIGRQLGIDIDFITPARAQDLAPILRPGGVKALTFAPRDGFVNPHQAAVGLATAAHRLGVTLHTHTRVTSITLGTDGRHRVNTERGEFHAPIIIDAAGAWTRLLGQEMGLWIPTVPVRHQYYITAPLPGVHPALPVIRFPDLGGYLRQEAGGLIVGGFETHPRSFDMQQQPAAFDIKDVPADMAVLQHFTTTFQPYVPVLAEAFIVAERRGLPTLTPDGDFLLSDIPGVPGFYVASGCCVTGISAAPVLGKLLAELIVDGTPSLDISSMHISRFGTEYEDTATLHRACEEVYGHYYALGRGKI